MYMKKLWQNLPNEVVYLIMEYNGIIKMRNGKYMNQILNVDNSYNLLLDYTRHKYRNFFGTNHNLHVDIYIPNTKKSIYYFATNEGYRVSLHKYDEYDEPYAEVLYCNYTE